MNGLPDHPENINPVPEEERKQLTRRQRLFVEYYLMYWDAQKAAIAAGYAETTARAKSYKFLKDLVIRDAIDRRVQEAALNSDEVLARLSQQATANIADFLDMLEATDPQTGEMVRLTLVDWKEVKDRGYLVKKVKANRDGSFELEMYDGQNALIKMGQHHKLFVEKIESTNYNVEVTADDLARAREEAEEYEKEMLGE